MDKVGRNDPCPCGSGKKYKKCCEIKSNAPKKIQAQIISPERISSSTQETSKVSLSFFQRSVTPISSSTFKEIKAQKTD